MQSGPYSNGDRPDIGRPANQTSSGGLGTIEYRYRNLLTSVALAIDPALQSFLQLDVPRLLTIARVAQAWVNATNAESSRQASEQIVASVRGLNSV